MTGPEIGLLIALFWAWWVIWWPGTTGGGLFLAMEGGRPEFPASSMWSSGWRGRRQPGSVGGYISWRGQMVSIRGRQLW